MRPSRPTSTSLLLTQHAALSLIAVGLALLLMHVAFPNWPTAAAFALVVLGASILTIKQFGRPAVIAGHLVAYSGLYLLFFGATCDAAARQSNSGLSTTQIIDLGLSTGVMAFVVQFCMATIKDDGEHAR
jgi:hypothetical protein